MEIEYKHKNDYKDFVVNYCFKREASLISLKPSNVIQRDFIKYIRAQMNSDLVMATDQIFEYLFCTLKYTVVGNVEKCSDMKQNLVYSMYVSIDSYFSSLNVLLLTVLLEGTQ